MTILATLHSFLFLAAQRESYSVGVGLVLLCAVLGLLVTLRPSKRTSEIKYKVED